MVRSPDTPTGPHGRAPIERFGLAAALLLALALRAWLAAGTSGLTMDSANYVRMAESLRAGRHFLAPAHYGYPALVALAGAALPGRELPARAVSMLASLALVAVAWWIANRRGGPRVAALAAVLVALHPLLAVFGAAIMTESAFLLLATGAIGLVDAGPAFAGGALAGVAYWVRPEGVLVGLGAAMARASRPRQALLVLAGLALALAPDLAFERWERGSWAASPKTGLFRPPPADWRAEELHVPVPGAPAPPPAAHWDAASLAAAAPAAFARHARDVLVVWPWPLLALSVVGLARRRGALLAPVLVVAVLPFVDVPDDPRFVLVLVPALAVGAAEAAAWLAARARERLAAPAARAAAVAAVGALVAAGLALAWTGPAGARALEFDDGPIAQMRGAGAWLREHGAPADRVMDRKSYVPFFAGMEHVQLPDDDLDTILAFARARHVRWLVVEEYVVRMFRPQLAPLLGDRAFRDRLARLRPVFAGRDEPGDGVAVFEVAGVAPDSAAAR